MFRLRHHMDSANLEIMCKSFVRPSLEYGNLEYRPAAPTHMFKLDKFQAAAEVRWFSSWITFLQERSFSHRFSFQVTRWRRQRWAQHIYTPVLDTYYPTFASRHDYKTIHIKERFDSRDTNNWSNLIEVLKAKLVKFGPNCPKIFYRKVRLTAGNQ